MKCVRFIGAMTMIAIAGALASCELFDDSESDPRINISIVGQGEVVLSPSGGRYEEGTVVTMTALPGPGHTLYGYEGDISSTDESVSVTMGDSNLDVTVYMPVFMTGDKRVIVKSADLPPTPLNGLRFFVDIDLPEEPLESGDGYRLWIRPFQFEGTTPAGGEATTYWYNASGVLEARATDLRRGGWIGYRDENDDFQYCDNGIVYTWRLSIARWDASIEENISTDVFSFDYEASID